MTTFDKPELPLVAAYACAVIAACALAGWVFDIAYLTSVFPGFPTMVPMTALLTLLSCAALLRLRAMAGAVGKPAAGSAPRWSPGLAAGLLAAAALAILLAHAMGRAPGPFMLRGGAGALGVWGVSSPVSAAMFGALGASLLAMASRPCVRHGQALALGVLLVALLTLAGYLFRDTFLYQLLPGKGTSIPTTMVLILLPLAVLALRPGEGIMVAVAGPDPGAWIARRLLLSALTMPVLLGSAAGLMLRVGAIDVGTAIAFLVWGMVVLFTAVSGVSH